MSKIELNRRTFILSTSTLVSASLLQGKIPNSSTNNPRKVALIGAGWYGKSDLFRLLQVADVEVVAVCDVDKKHLEEAAQLIAQKQKSKNTPKTYEDYRDLLKAHKLDLVVIGSPDHWHALQAIAAMKAGAHVYLQKPISRDVLEGEAIVATARKLNKKVQIGTQRRSTPHMIDAKENIIEKGLLGKISHVDMCCYYHMRDNAKREVQEVPAHLNYELWTGPAPMRPYDGSPHSRWRSYMEYCNGITGDMCVHMFDTVRWLLKLKWPKQITASGGIYLQKDSKSNIADTQTAIFEYEDLNCVWQHRTWGTFADPDYPWAFIIYGEKGTLKGSTMKYEFIPVGKGERIIKDVVYEREAYPEDEKEPRIEMNAAPATRRQMQNLLSAIDNNHLPVADVEEGHISSSSCILANISMELKRPVQYDPKTKTCLNDPEATKMLKRSYRGNWKHPAG